MKGHSFKHKSGVRSFFHPINHSWWSGIFHAPSDHWYLDGPYGTMEGITRNDAITILKHGIQHWIMEQTNVAG